MPQSPHAPFLRDPITVSRKELIEHYRTQAARYTQLAERQRRSSIYDGLVGLARQCTAMADALELGKADQNTKPQLSESDILLLLNRVIAEDKTAAAAPPNDGVESPPPPRQRELSLDEILLKVQRDIAEGRPAAAD